MSEPKNLMETKLGVSVKAICIMLCIGGFIWNSFHTFKSFIGDETITSNHIEVNSRLMLPSVTFCATTGFKEEVVSYASLELQNYIDNTYDLNEMISLVKDNAGNNFTVEELLQVKTYKSETLKVSVTFSAYRGRCYTIQYKKEVS